MSVKAEQITTRHAEEAFYSKEHTDEYSALLIDGEPVWWWSNEKHVWFYTPGDEGENTLKRFDVITSIVDAAPTAAHLGGTIATADIFPERNA